MASPGSFAAGGVLTAAEMNALPGGVVDIIRTTGGTNPRTFATGTHTLETITFTAVAGRQYKATAQIAVFDGTAAMNAYLVINVGGADISNVYQRTDGTSAYSSIHNAITFTATGSTNVVMKINGSASTLRVYMGAAEGWLFMVEDIGPTP